MPTPDRSFSVDGLLQLDAACKALRHHRISSPEQLGAADADTLASIGRVLDGGDPVAVRLLFWDAQAEGIDDEVALSSAANRRRLLILSYREGGEGERRAWAVLRATVGQDADSP